MAHWRKWSEPTAATMMTTSMNHANKAAGKRVSWFFPCSAALV